MSVKKNLEKANKLMKAGNTNEAAEIYSEIYRKSNNVEYKLTAICCLSSLLNPANDNDKLIEICDDGINIATSQNKFPLKAMFLAQKAHILHIRNSIFTYKRKNIKLAAYSHHFVWTEFSLEMDKKEYELLTKEIDENNKLIDELLVEALNIQKIKGNNSAVAEVLMSKSKIYTERRHIFTLEAIKSSKLFSLFKYFHLKYPFMFKLKDKKKIREYSRISDETMLEAAELYRRSGDMEGEASAYFNLAVDLKARKPKSRIMYKYYNKAKEIAKSCNYTILLQKAKLFEESLSKSRKKVADDFPTYHVISGN